MAIKNALRERPRELFAGGKLETLYSEHITDDKIYCFQQVAWEINKATVGGNTRVRLFIAGHGYNHYLEEQDAPVAGKLYTYSEPVWLIPRERLAIEIDNADATTTAEMHLTGYWTKFEGGIV